MTLYEEVYYNMPELSKFYRFEGFKSYPRFSNQKDIYMQNSLRYVYFSRTQKHHMYYVIKRLKQLINEEVLKDTDLKLDKQTIVDSTLFNEITKYIENFSFDDRMLSIEFSVSPLMTQLLDKNTISNRCKKTNDRRIERVDYNHRHGGGLGFCDEWLKVFELLTFFYSYRRITNENILDFLYMQRRNLLQAQSILNSVSFLLDPRTIVIKINDKIYSDFCKYELMDSLQKITEDELYFPESILAHDQNESIKSIVGEYILQREYLLELSETIYQKNLSKTLKKEK